MLNSNESITLKSTLRQNFTQILYPRHWTGKGLHSSLVSQFIQWLDLRGRCFSFDRSQRHLYKPPQKRHDINPTDPKQVARDGLIEDPLFDRFC